MRLLTVNERYYPQRMLKEDKSYKFKAPRGIEKINIFFSYLPRLACGAEAKKQLRNAVDKYVDMQMETEEVYPEDFLPVENFLTLSLTFEGRYIGTYHNKADPQEIILTPNRVEKGFSCPDQLWGDWEIQVNNHSIASKLNITLEIEGHR